MCLLFRSIALVFFRFRVQGVCGLLSWSVGVLSLASLFRCIIPYQQYKRRFSIQHSPTVVSTFIYFNFQPYNVIWFAVSLHFQIIARPCSQSWMLHFEHKFLQWEYVEYIEFMQWGYVEYITSNYVLLAKIATLLVPRGLSISQQVFQNSGHHLEFQSMFANFAQCFAIFLGVFSFGWARQNYEQKFAFTTKLQIFGWSNQNSKPKYSFIIRLRISIGPKKASTKKPHSRVDYTILVGPTKIVATKTITQKPFCLGQAKITLLNSEEEKMNKKSHINNAKSRSVQKTEVMFCRHQAKPEHSKNK